MNAKTLGLMNESTVIPTQPNIKQATLKCFGFKKTSKKDIVSPEYKMADRRKTRQHSKKQQDVEEDEQDPEQGEQGEHESDEEEQYHSAVLPCPEPIDRDIFDKYSKEDKMETLIETINELCYKITEIDININHDSDGINTKLQTAQTQADNNKSTLTGVTSTIQTLESEKKKITDDLIAANNKIVMLQVENKTIRGTLQKQSCQLKTLNEKVAMLTARSMERNVTISGLTGDNKDEDCAATVTKFLKEKVEIDVGEEEILVAHRIGKPQQRRDRLMLVRCELKLKERIFQNVSNLKDKKNEKDELYFVNKQLPEMLAEKNRQVREKIREQKHKDRNLPIKERAKIQVVNQVVHINGDPAIEYLKPIEVNEMFPDQQEKEKQSKIKTVAADVVSEKGSTFMAYATKVSNIHEVRRAYRKIRILYPCADHVVAAYLLRNNSGYQDDNEHGAGYRLLAAIRDHRQDLKTNYAVFVVRIYGGTHLGSQRFTLINKAGQDALTRLH